MKRDQQKAVLNKRRSQDRWCHAQISGLTRQRYLFSFGRLAEEWSDRQSGQPEQSAVGFLEAIAERSLPTLTKETIEPA
jgi:hypothetical protein